MSKTIVEELVGVLGLDVNEKEFSDAAKSLDNVKKQFDRVAKAAGKFALAGGALLGFTVITNKLIAEQENLTRSVDLAGDTFEAYGSLASQAGLDTEVVIDLVEELNNKLGESKGLKELNAVKEATKILGIEFKNIKDLKPEEQFFKVLDAAKKLEDQQKAVSAVDILLGGEANKFVGFIRDQDESLKDLLDSHKALNFLTNENRDAAVEFNKSFTNVSTIFVSASKQMSAFLGRALKPILDFFVDWVAENKEVAQTIVKVFSFIIPAALGVFGIAVGVITAKLVVMAIALLGVTLPAIGMAALFTAIGVAIALVVEDIVSYIRYGDEASTITGKLIGYVKELWELFKGAAVDFTVQAMIRLNRAISAPLNAIRKMIGYLRELGEQLGSGVFDVVQRVSRVFGGEDSPLPSSQFANVGSGFAGSSGGSVSTQSNSSQNVFNIDATGMDSSQLNQAIDSRVGQHNAVAANSNNTGIVR